MEDKPLQLIPHSQPLLGEAEIKKASAVIASGRISQGRVVSEFETLFADCIGVRHAVAVSSGTAALHLTLAAMGINVGDQVIVPSYVCCALLNAVAYVGAQAVLADIDPESFNIDVTDVKKRITDRTRVIIVPHMFGRAADLKALLDLEVPIIEDCAQATGAMVGGKVLGTFGQAAIFSFYATKVMTTGEGGMVVTASDRLYRQLLDLREYDHKDAYRVRFNYKMTDLQAAVGICQLERLADFIHRRRELAARYRQALSGLPIQLPEAGGGHIFFRYVIDTGQEVTPLIEALRRRGITGARPVYKPLHHYLNQPGYPGAERAWQAALSIPLYPALSDHAADVVCSALIDCFEGE